MELARQIMEAHYKSTRLQKATINRNSPPRLASNFGECNRVVCGLASPWQSCLSQQDIGILFNLFSLRILFSSLGCRTEWRELSIEKVFALKEWKIYFLPSPKSFRNNLRVSLLLPEWWSQRRFFNRKDFPSFLFRRLNFMTFLLNWKSSLNLSVWLRRKTFLSISSNLFRFYCAVVHIITSNVGFSLERNTSHNASLFSKLNFIRANKLLLHFPRLLSARFALLSSKRVSELSRHYHHNRTCVRSLAGFLRY